MEGFGKQIARQLFVSGDAWERAQRRKEARRVSAQRQGLDVDELPRRSYRILEAYEGRVEEAFLERCQRLMQRDEYWEVIPPGRRTHRFQSETVLLLCRACSRIHSIAKQRRNYPN